jgi:DNA replication and repair protein RecF
VHLAHAGPARDAVPSAADAGRALACRSLRVRGFRNLEDATLEFPAAGVAVVGDNGAGKTNLLEALYYLEIFRSFRGAPDEQLVRFGADGFHLLGEFEDPTTRGRTEIAAAYDRRGRRKRVTVDGVEPERLADAIGGIGIVVFSPSDLALVGGPPGERRRFLDIVLSLGEPGYVSWLQRYRQVLRQRNAALRSGPRGADLGAWDEGLVVWGARIVAARSAWVARWAEPFAERVRAIGPGVDASLAYRPALGGGDAQATTEADAAAALRAGLARLAGRERERRMTLVGPHRDALDLAMHGASGALDLREFGSGGQQRTAAIALRMIEADSIRATRGRLPLILLDDVFAELDAGRARRILERLEADRGGQVVLTAPKPADVALRDRDAAGGVIPSLTPWRIAAGRIEP